MARESKPAFDPDYIRDLSEKVYRDRLGAEDAASMIEKDNDGGTKLRSRAASYDGLTRAYLKALGVEPHSVLREQDVNIHKRGET